MHRQHSHVSVINNRNTPSVATRDLPTPPYPLPPTCQTPGALLRPLTPRPLSHPSQAPGTNDRVSPPTSGGVTDITGCVSPPPTPQLLVSGRGLRGADGDGQRPSETEPVAKDREMADPNSLMQGGLPGQQQYAYAQAPPGSIAVRPVEGVLQPFPPLIPPTPAT